MDDKELRETLASICEMLRDEISATASVNYMMTALARAILAQNHPLALGYETQWNQLASGLKDDSPPPAIPRTNAALLRLDELIRKLTTD
jgi:hypothetical protein